ncbi:hypothetical protein DOTSEDRAFT_73742 [Dothistroma septosporum NZE10]|uniref:Uncharacterized protein n=1 Tax=Dothistroma septosporum (strain NZE10 / CBS 128990) TaxID=675120 RepID=N1PH12_DOTSN|nr:hypothetical protein DOTSEDRAFT_73742 [Dothistroma septosporum NZE10]
MLERPWYASARYKAQDSGGRLGDLGRYWNNPFVVRKSRLIWCNPLVPSRDHIINGALGASVPAQVACWGREI